MFTIFHTNDFHNHLKDSQAARLSDLRRSPGACDLLLDAGDAISAGNISFHAEEPILEQMRDIGYDAMTVGNREFHFSRLGFHSKVARAGFPILCANVSANHGADSEQAGDPLPWSETSTTDDPPVRPYQIFTTPDARRIVVFGLTVPMITRRMLVRRVSAYVFDDPIDAARKLVPILKATLHPDLLIALTHIGIQQDRALAAAAPEVDLIIGGHTHVVLECGERVGETLIVQAGSHGRFLGRVETEFNGLSRPAMRATLEAL